MRGDGGGDIVIAEGAEIGFSPEIAERPAFVLRECADKVEDDVVGSVATVEQNDAVPPTGELFGPHLATRDIGCAKPHALLGEAVLVDGDQLSQPGSE